MPDVDRPPARELWAALHLLDRHLVDRRRVSVGKVDDLELELPSSEDELPVVTAVLCGQAALARRLSPRLGRAVEHLRRVIDPVPDPGPGRIPADHLMEIGIEVVVAVDGEELSTTAVDRWLAHAVLRHIPGSGITDPEGSDATE